LAYHLEVVAWFELIPANLMFVGNDYLLSQSNPGLIGLQKKWFLASILEMAC
jgi:hypothetical protein